MPCQIFDLRATQGPSRRAAGAAQPNLPDILTQYPAARFAGFLDKVRCAEIADRLRKHRADWSKDYDGEQYSYPDNFYARAHDGGQRRYFDRSAALNAEMERGFGAERARLLAFVQDLMPGTAVEIRAGWTGREHHVGMARGVSETGG